MKAKRTTPSAPTTWFTEEQKAEHAAEAARRKHEEELRGRLRAAEDAHRREEEARERQRAAEAVRRREEEARERELASAAARRREVEARERERAAQDAFTRALDANYLSTQLLDFIPAGHDEFVGDLEDVRTRYVLDWCSQAIGRPIDVAQARAVGSTGCHTLTVARAGSGKTRTLVCRTAFLVRHCGVDPSQILLLAFNRKAAEDIRTRLDSLGAPCPHVMTFHALAYAIARPEESIVYDEPSEEGKRRASLTQRVINEILRDPVREAQIHDVMSLHFKTDWETVIEARVAMSRDEGLLLRRSLERETLDGTKVKSFGEKVIANFLFEHSISYGYERNHRWGARNYRPDFTLSGRKIVIEYFGLAGNPKYDNEMEEKRQYWALRPGWTLLEYQPSNLKDSDGGSLAAKLASDLARLKVPLARLSDDEIWRRVQARFRTRFAELLTGLIGRCRKALLTPDSLESRLSEHRCLNDIERDVLSITSEVYRSYLDRLEAEKQEDFDGLLQRAAKLVRDGTTAFERRSGAGDLTKIRFVMVDEFQDLSPLFDELLGSIRSQIRNVQVFSVGDDWQAINGFAGSDLRFFREFKKQFEPSAEFAITTNYRSSPEVVDVCNRIMTGNGAPATAHTGASPGEVLVADLSAFRPSDAESSHWQSDTITPAVRRIIQRPLKDGRSIAVLARQRHLPYQCTHAR